METSTLEKKIGLLSTDQKLKVEGYIDALLEEIEKAADIGQNIPVKAGFGGGRGLIAYMADDFDAPLELADKKGREFGSLKGFVKFMAYDFNEPLADFNEYM